MVLKSQMSIFLCMLSSRFSGCSSGSKETKPFINEFFFKLTDEAWLTSVQKRASDMRFVWQKKVGNVLLHAHACNVSFELNGFSG